MSSNDDPGITAVYHYLTRRIVSDKYRDFAKLYGDKLISLGINSYSYNYYISQVDKCKFDKKLTHREIFVKLIDRLQKMPHIQKSDDDATVNFLHTLTKIAVDMHKQPSQEGLVGVFQSHSKNALHDILEDLLQKKRVELVEKHSESDTPFTDFIYSDVDYGMAREAFITLEFYIEVGETIAATHREIAFDVLTKAFESSLKNSLGSFTSPHKKGLHKCYQVLDDYRRNFFTKESVKVSRKDVSGLLQAHLDILAGSD